MKQFTYIVQDEMGLHARPAGLLVKEAGRLKSKIIINSGNNSADAKKIFSLMGLAVKKGEEITVSVQGESETEDTTILQEFIEKTF